MIADTDTPAKNAAPCLSLAFDEQEPFVRLTVHKDISLEIAKLMSQSAVQGCQKYGVNACLADVRGVRNRANPLDNYRFAYEEAQRLGIGRNMHIAVITSADDSSHEFIETVMSNAGFSMQMFTDEDAATQWLKIQAR